MKTILMFSMSLILFSKVVQNYDVSEVTCSSLDGLRGEARSNQNYDRAARIINGNKVKCLEQWPQVVSIYYYKYAFFL